MEIQNLKKYFPIYEGFFNRKVGDTKAVDDVSLDINLGETHSVVGESGSGKTTLGKTISMIYPPTAGKILFNGVDSAKLDSSEMKQMRRSCQMVFQDPSSSLNPKRRIKDIIAEPLVIHKIGKKSERVERINEIAQLVELPEDRLLRLPHMLSGGEKQRVGVARALIMNPKFVILDEPTSSLDVSVQAKIIKLLMELKKNMGLTYLFISHDLSLVRCFSQIVTVMYLGKVMETAPTIELFSNPQHPYLVALLSTIPVVSQEEYDLIPEKVTMKGEISSASNIPSGCVFHPRCNKVMDKCSKVVPDLIKVSKDHYVRCHLYQ